MKAVIWSVALGSGTSGGVLAPLLMMGGALGALFGGVVPVGDAGLWALIGMAAIMGGTMRSPLTAIVFALELTHNMSALLPLAIACVMAHATTVLLLRRSILTEKVARRGHHVMREYIVDPFETMRVAEIMAHPVETLPADMPIGDVVAFFSATRAGAAQELSGGRRPRRRCSGWCRARTCCAGRWRAGRRADAERRRFRQELTIGYDDELVGHLADRMAAADASRVPILRRSDGAVVGLVARRDLLRVRCRAGATRTCARC